MNRPPMTTAPCPRCLKLAIDRQIRAETVMPLPEGAFAPRGRHGGAMRGCVKLFPVSRVATEDLRLRDKLASLVKRFGQSATLNRRDTEALDACEAFFVGTRDERSALSVIDGAKRANSARYRR